MDRRLISVWRRLALLDPTVKPKYIGAALREWLMAGDSRALCECFELPRRRLEIMCELDSDYMRFSRIAALDLLLDVVLYGYDYRKGKH